LSIVIAVVSGAAALRRCLTALCTQTRGFDYEITVPYDRWSLDVAELGAEFPDVRFHRIDDLGAAASATTSAHAHRLYDRRRAAGLALARGTIVAMTEDHAVPASDWCAQLLAAHAGPHAVVGGAIENAVDRPLNWAWYYCDFGRYGRPFAPGAADYVSDVNVAYKREALAATHELWRDAYHETTLHWALRERGQVLFLDPGPVVYQHRPTLDLARALRERVEWGRVFAETRAAASGSWQRVAYAAATPILPLLLLGRAVHHMRRQRRSLRQIATTLPLALILLSAWAIGECTGYLAVAPSLRVGAVPS
jgi:hypothetical protein